MSFLNEIQYIQTNRHRKRQVLCMVKQNNMGHVTHHRQHRNHLNQSEIHNSKTWNMMGILHKVDEWLHISCCSCKINLKLENLEAPEPSSKIWNCLPIQYESCLLMSGICLLLIGCVWTICWPGKLPNARSWVKYQLNTEIVTSLLAGQAYSIPQRQ